MDHKLIKTNRDVYAAIWARHNSEMEPFGSCTDVGGDNCRVTTLWGIKKTDCAVLRHDVSWERDPEIEHGRLNERHEYWLCIGRDKNED